MNTYLSSDEPPKRVARPIAGRARLRPECASPQDPVWCELLESWLHEIHVLERSSRSPLVRARLQDSDRICTELLQVLRGIEFGEGCASERSLVAVRALGRTQALSTMFACPGGTFIELIATAPWNLLDPPDPRTLRGAGTALVGHAVSWSRLRGCLGRVALQAENPRTFRFYERFGFRRMVPEDAPLELVPMGESGWSLEVLRVAQGCPGPEEELSPWLVLDPPADARECWGGPPAA